MKSSTLPFPSRPTTKQGTLLPAFLTRTLAWLRTHPTGCEIAARRMKRF